MASFYDKKFIEGSDEMDVLFIVYPNIVLLDLVGPLQVFTHARKDSFSDPAYRISIASKVGGGVHTNTILPVNSDSIETWFLQSNNKTIHTLVVVGGDGAYEAIHDRLFVKQIQQLAERSVRVCSVCSGALLLAAAGVLDGRRAVTHWEDCEQLAREYPAVKVELDPIYIKDGNIWTSAGITAGIDMALAIIGEDLGKHAAIEMARSLVTPMVRSGGQSQFSPELDRQAIDTKDQFAFLHDWVANNIGRKISIDDMAKECGMSSRNFSRRYKETMGTSPAKAIEVIRVNKARELLAATSKSIKVIAVDCGFMDDERMRRAFLRQIKTSPSQYRKQFQLH